MWCTALACPTVVHAPKQNCVSRQIGRKANCISRVEFKYLLAWKSSPERLEWVSRRKADHKPQTVVAATRDDQEERVVEETPNGVDTYGLFDLQKYLEPLEAPWGAKNAVLGIAGWGASFLLVGLAFLPIAKFAAGPEGFSALSQHDKSIFALINQIVETAVGIGIVTTSAGGFYNSRPSVLTLDLRQPFAKPNGWAFWGIIGIFLAPAAVFLSSTLWEALGAEDLQARGTADAISQILTLDGVTFASLFTTTAILAPLLEETVFRGFLLPSLSKAMPTPLAVLLSSVAFGLVHFSPRDTPQLTALGILLGFSYIRSKNLLTPMMIHGTWNGTVLTILYVLQMNGVDIQHLLHTGEL